MKCGVVITTHGNNGIFCIQCLECYLRHLPDAFIILYVNESSDPKILNIKKMYPTVKYIYIEDQHKNGGLTATWNDGIKLCIENDCKVIVLSNDDIFFDDSIKHIIKHASNVKDKMKYFGPITNNPGPSIMNKAVQYGTQSLNKPNYVSKHNNKFVNINGFFMVFPKHVLENNMYDKTHFFDPNKPFDSNEVEWFDRFMNKKGLPIIVPETFIYHYKLKLWKNKVQNDVCIFTINFGGYEGNKLYLKNDTDIDNIYFTDNPCMKKDSIINKCIKDNIMFFYIDTKKFTSKNWWAAHKQAQRMIKTCPQAYLPLNYTKSIYIDGNIIFKKKMFKKDVNKLLENHDIVCYNHPGDRGNPPTVLAEMNAILKHHVEKKENLDKIMDILKENNFPDNIGLTETCILVRNHSNIYNFSKEWCELIQICIRDQMSFDYLLWKHKINFKRYTIDKLFTKKLLHINPKGRNIK